MLPAPAWTRIGGIFRLNFAAKLNDKVFLLNVILKNLASQLDRLVGDSSVIAAKKCSNKADRLITCVSPGRRTAEE